MRYPFRLLSLVIATATLLPAVERPGMARSFAAQRRVAAETKQADEPSAVLLEVEGALEPGDETLSDGSLFDVYPFEGEAGQSITIRMESDEFDTYLILVDAAGEKVGENDDNGSNTNSALTVTLPETGTYSVVANAYDETGQGAYQLSVVTVSATEAQQAEAGRLLQQGIQQYQVSQFRAALNFWQQALEIYQSIGYRQGEARSLGNLGIAYFSLGQYQQAIDFHQQSLDTAREIGDREGEADNLGNLGNVYISFGQYQKAIDFFRQSLDIAREIGNREGEAGNLGNLGAVYRFLGQYQQAIDFHQQSLVIQRQIGDREGEASSLGNLGVAHRFLGQYPQAIEFHQQSLVIQREIGDRQSLARILSSLGIVYTTVGQYQQAINLQQQSLAIAREIGDRKGEASYLTNLGYVYQSLGQSQQAIDLQQQSLAIAREIGDREGEANSLNNIGASLNQISQFVEAETALTQSIEIFESLRTGLPDAQLISIADTQARTYANLESALIAQNKTTEALTITERGRAQAFALQLALRQGNIDETPVTYPTIADIQRIAQQQNATLVEYSLHFDEALYIWVIQPSGDIQFRQVDLTNLDDDTLTRFIEQTRDSLGVRGSRTGAPPQADPIALAQLQAETDQNLKDLHDLLIDPIADLLPTDPNANIVFIPQGELFLVPFPALKDDSNSYLIERHTLSTAPSIQVLGLAAEEASASNRRGFTNPLIVGNPTMPEVTLNVEDELRKITLSSLPGAEAEAWAIGDFLNLTPLTRDNATEARIKQDLPTADLIHLATHGLFEYGDPNASGIIDFPGAVALAAGDGEDGLLTASEILDMDLQAQLAILSACDTGRGKISGDGVIGLSRSLISAGVPSVIVSLWAVPDSPTAELMTEFYRQLDQGQTKAQALRQAMLITIQNHPDPKDWAAFTLIGEAE